MSYTVTQNAYLGGEQTGSQLFLWNSSTNNWVPVYTAPLSADLSAVTITTIATVITPTTGKKFRFIGGNISVSAAVSVLFEDNAAGTTIYRTPKLLADTPFNFDLYNGRASAAVNRVLKATSSAAATITGTLFYTEEA